MPTIATSGIAYRSGKAHRPSQRQRIFLAILGAGSRGLTLDEVIVALSLSACGSRFSELKKMGVIQDTGTTRLTRYGCPATVWIVPPTIALKAKLKLGKE